MKALKNPKKVGTTTDLGHKGKDTCEGLVGKKPQHLGLRRISLPNKTLSKKGRFLKLKERNKETERVSDEGPFQNSVIVTKRNRRLGVHEQGMD